MESKFWKCMISVGGDFVWMIYWNYYIWSLSYLVMAMISKFGKNKI